MGCRTYIYNSDGNVFLCLGKLVAYVDPSELPNLKKWCGDNITDEFDRIYLFGGKDGGNYWPGFFNLGYCYESITFNERFNTDQIADFVTAFIRDKANGQHPCFPSFSSEFYKGLGNLLAGDTEFMIEWTEGG